MIQNVEQAGWKVLSTWAMGDTLENLARAPEAEVRSGWSLFDPDLQAAEILQERFRTYYVTVTPIRGIYENSVECNGRERAGSISGRREADQKRIYAGIR